MSTAEEQEIRGRLRSALEAVPPGSPPAAAIVRTGRGIRRRRLISAGAALAAVIGLGAALPGLVGHDSAEPAAARRARGPDRLGHDQRPSLAGHAHRVGQ